MTSLRIAFAAFTLAATVAEPALAQSRVVALSEHDENAYRAAFAAIEDHNFRAATSALARVDDDVLAPVVRGRMLLTQAYHADWSAYTSWLNRYGDYGMAPAVYDRAMDSRSRRARRHGVTAPSPVSGHGRTLPGTAPPVDGDSASDRAALSRVADLIGSGDFDAARSLAQTEVYGPRAGQAQWQLGLIAYRLRDYAEAARQFEASAQWEHHGGWARAAAHYWAARSLLAAGETRGVSAHFEAAAQMPWTFYGQLAEAQLGRDSALTFTAPETDATTIQHFIEQHPAARRAAALAQLGRLSEAEAELRRLHSDLSQDDDRAFLALAVALQAPSAQLRAAEYGGPREAAGFCPATSFVPADGFTLDRALLYAIVRQESYFNPKAVSTSNARGLMQLLPSTARDMDRSTNYRRAPTALYDPNLNMALGQDYVQWLMDQFHNDGDLGRLFASYNGGPGWLSRWLATQPSDLDPLLVMEMMPREQSRDYAERVLSHMTLCRKAFHQPTPELDHLAAGEPAIYTPLDHRGSGARPSS